MTEFTYTKCPAQTYKLTEYEVHLLDGEYLGKVYSAQVTSYRKHGRIITGVNGRPTQWGYHPRGGARDRYNPGAIYNTRERAARSLRDTIEQQSAQEA